MSSSLPPDGTGSFAVPDYVPPPALSPRSRAGGSRSGSDRRLALAALAAAAVVAVAAVTTSAHQPIADAAGQGGRAGGAGATAAHAQPPAPAHGVTLNWVGDIALSSERGLPPEGLTGALAPVASALHDGDASVGNLEGTLSVGGGSKCGVASSNTCFAFQAPPATAGELRSLGFSVVNQANNHSLDYGDTGRAQTLSALQQYRLAYTGLPGQITTLSLHGTRVAFVGFAPYNYTADLLDIPTAQTLVREARRQAPLVIAIIHAGAEGIGATHTPVGDELYLGEDRGDARGFAHAVIDAGAAAVVGSGPHVVRGVEDYRGHLIAYSTGNFVGYRTLGHGGLLSASGILHFTLAPDGRLAAGRWISLALENGLPHPDRTNTSAQLVSTLSQQDFPADHFVIDSAGGFHL